MVVRVRGDDDRGGGDRDRVRDVDGVGFVGVVAGVASRHGVPDGERGRLASDARRQPSAHRSVDDDEAGERGARGWVWERVRTTEHGDAGWGGVPGGRRRRGRDGRRGGVRGGVALGVGRVGGVRHVGVRTRARAA